MKMILMIILTSLSVVSCKTPNAPKPPKIHECGLIDEGSPYLYCRFSDGSSGRWRVTLNRSQSKKWVCTTVEDHAEAWKYGEELSRWIGRNCR